MWQCKCTILLPRATETKHRTHTDVSSKQVQGDVENFVTDDAVVAENQTITTLTLTLHKQSKALGEPCLALQCAAVGTTLTSLSDRFGFGFSYITLGKLINSLGPFPT